MAMAEVEVETTNLKQYLARVRKNEISTLAHDSSSWHFDHDENEDDFTRGVGALFWERRHDPLPLQALQLHMDHLFATTSTTTTASPKTDYPILEYLHRTTSLKSFGLSCDGFRIEFDVDKFARISDAISANISIVELNIEHVHHRSAVKLLQNIFQELAKRGSGRVPLEQVHLFLVGVKGKTLAKSSSGFAQYFKSLLDRDAKLKQLKLSLLQVDVSLVKFFKKYFRQTERIVLFNCSFDVESCERFGSLMRMVPAGGGGDADSGTSKESVDVSIRYDNRTVGQYDEIPPSSFGAFLRPSTGPLKIRDLDITIGETRHVPILSYYLPQSLYLTSLEANLRHDFQSDENRDVPGEYFHKDRNLRRKQLLDGIRRNGSLHSLEVYIDNGTPRPDNYFSPRDERKIEAWVTRNQKLPELLSSPRLNDGRGVLVNGISSLDGTTDLELFPTLFTTASEATSMAYANVLIGLMAAVKDGTLRMGPAPPCNGGKRKGTTTETTAAQL